MRRVLVVLWRRPVIRLERRSNGTFLRAHTKHDMVLMYTDDVDGVWLSICKRAGWKLQLVDHIEFKKELYPSGRFAHVFTKLHAVAMVKYDKVIVLDTDVLIRNDMDELLEREALAAV